MFLTSVLGWFHLEFPLRNLTIGPTTHVTLSQNSHHSEIDPATPSPPPSGTGPTLFLHLVNDFPPCHPILNQTREWNWRHRLNEPNVLFGGLGGGGGCGVPKSPVSGWPGEMWSLQISPSEGAFVTTQTAPSRTTFYLRPPLLLPSRVSLFMCWVSSSW